MFLENLVFDAVEPQRLGRFWEAVVGGERLTDEPDAFETRLSIPEGPVLNLCFQRNRRSTGPNAGGMAYHSRMRLTAAISKDGEWYVAQCLEVDIASQGHTLDEARNNLAEALALHFEDEDVQIGEPPVIVPIDIAV